MLPPVEQYEAAVEWWRLLWQKIPSEGWISPFYNNPDQDGNPIFSAWSPTERRVIRVLQLSNRPRDEDEDDDVHLDFWWDVFGDDVQELIVCCDGLDAEEVDFVRSLIERWVSGNLAFGSEIR